MRSIYLTPAIFAAVALGCTPLPAPVIDPAACTYDRCGLWGAGGNVYRGTTGEFVAHLGGFTPARMDRHLAGHDSAMVLARQYRSLHTQSRLAAVVATPAIVFTPLVVLAGVGGGSPPPAVLAVLAGGAASLVFSFVRSEQASRRMGRALFLYNRDLPRIVPDSIKPPLPGK